MVILHEINIAALTGKAGDFVYKNYNGKKVICQKPSSYRINYGSAAVEERNKFSVTAHLSKAISSLQYLKLIWNSIKKPRNSIHHTICKYNYKES